MKKKIFNYLLLIVLMGATFKVVFLNTNLSNIAALFHRTNKVYIFLGMATMILYWIFDASVIYLLTKRISKRKSKFSAFRTTIVGQYYATITPFASGAQPAQLYTMSNNDKIPAGEATAVLVNRFIAYEIVVTVYSLILAILGAEGFQNVINPLLPFIYIGFIVHIVGVTFIVMVVYSPASVEKIAGIIMGFFHKIKLIKDVEGRMKKLGNYMKDYKRSLDLVVEDKMLIIKVAVFTLLELTAYFSITYFVYKALNLHSSSFLATMSLQAILYMAVSFIPTPGGMGASEAGFYALYRVVFGADVIAFALLLWRGINYYFNLIASGILTAVLYFAGRGRRNKEISKEAENQGEGHIVEPLHEEGEGFHFGRKEKIK